MTSNDGVEVIELEDITDPRVTDLQTSSTIRSRSTHIAGLEERRVRAVSYVKQVPDDDDIVIVEDIEIQGLVIPPKLLRVDFPQAEDCHDQDVAEVIRKKFSKLGIGKGSKDSDILALLSSDQQHSTYSSWRARIKKAANYGEDLIFSDKVTKKSSEMNIGRLEAIFEVYTDALVESANGINKALHWILRQKNITEFCAEVFITLLLQRNASVTTAGADRNTPLHLAAMMGFTNVARKLINNGAYIAAENDNGQNPLYLAVKNNHCAFAVLMVKNMEPARVREMFEGKGEQTAKLSLHSFLENEAMNELVLAVLDTMMEPLEDGHNTYIVYYNILDGDEEGRPPNDQHFKKSDKTCLHKIAKSNNKEVVYHPLVRLLLRRKWKKFARHIFVIQFLCFLTFMASLTCALVLAAKKPDPRKYDKPVDIFRGLCEACILLIAAYATIAELNQMKIHKKHYLSDYYNYLDLLSVIFTFLIIPFRAVGFNIQWLFASLCYLFNGLRAFKYAPVFRSTGAYTQILFQIIVRDIVQFGSIFSVFLFSFSGAFYLALRGEVQSEGVESYNTTVENGSIAPENILNTNLYSYPFETSEIYLVWFTGIRVMIEGSTVVDQYFGPNGFKWFGVIIYATFLFLVIVVLLNLLIAQMSDTYGSIQQDAQRSLVINRALIVAKVEHNSLIARDCRKTFYKGCEVIKNPHDVLEKWEVPPINEVNRKLKKIEISLKRQEESIDEVRSVIMEKLNELQWDGQKLS